MWVCVYVNVCVCVNMCVYVNVCVCVYVYVGMYVCLCKYMYICMYVCMYVHVYAFPQVLFQSTAVERTNSVYIQSNEIHNEVALIKFLLVLRCQLYMFRTATVHPQELLCRYCMCRLWYAVRDALSDTSSCEPTPEDGPLRSETCRADT